jgi:hypothetical protein
MLWLKVHKIGPGLSTTWAFEKVAKNGLEHGSICFVALRSIDVLLQCANLFKTAVIYTNTPLPWNAFTALLPLFQPETSSATPFHIKNVQHCTFQYFLANFCFNMGF